MLETHFPLDLSAPNMTLVIIETAKAAWGKYKKHHNYLHLATSDDSTQPSSALPQVPDAGTGAAATDAGTGVAANAGDGGTGSGGSAGMTGPDAMQGSYDSEMKFNIYYKNIFIYR